MEMCKKDPDSAGFKKIFEQGAILKSPKIAPGVNTENLEKLKALGYVE